MKMTLPINSEERKQVPIFSGFMAYFPAAIAGAARVSMMGKIQHRLSKLGHNRSKSGDHSDCVPRHMLDAADLEAMLERNESLSEKEREELIDRILTESSCAVWRVSAWSQELHEKYGRAPMAPAAFVPKPDVFANTYVPPPPPPSDIPEFLRPKQQV